MSFIPGRGDPPDLATLVRELGEVLGKIGAGGTLFPGDPDPSSRIAGAKIGPMPRIFNGVGEEQNEKLKALQTHLVVAMRNAKAVHKTQKSINNILNILDAYLVGINAKLKKLKTIPDDATGNLADVKERLESFMRGADDILGKVKIDERDNKEGYYAITLIRNLNSDLLNERERAWDRTIALIEKLLSDELINAVDDDVHKYKKRKGKDADDDSKADDDPEDDDVPEDDYVPEDDDVPEEGDDPEEDDDPEVAIPKLPRPRPNAKDAIARELKLGGMRGTSLTNAELGKGTRKFDITAVNGIIESKFKELKKEADLTFDAYKSKRTTRDAGDHRPPKRPKLATGGDYTESDQELNWQALGIYAHLKTEISDAGTDDEELICKTDRDETVFTCNEQPSLTDSDVKEIVIKPAKGTLEYINQGDTGKELAIAGTAIIDAAKQAATQVGSAYAEVRMPGGRTEPLTDGECRKVLLLARKLLLGHVLPKVDAVLLEKLQRYIEKLDLIPDAKISYYQANPTAKISELNAIAPGMTFKELVDLTGICRALENLKDMDEAAYAGLKADDQENLISQSLERMKLHEDPVIGKHLTHTDHPLKPRSSSR